MKYGIYVYRGKRVDTRTIQKYDGREVIDNFELVATAKTLKEAETIYKNLEGNFWN